MRITSSDPSGALRAAVQSRFGVTPRPAQLALIHRTVAGQSSLGIMPTGSGKSLSFQAAAALMDGMVLVVSPLLSLMRDQVEKLRQLGGPDMAPLRVARLDASLERDEAREVLAQIRGSGLDLLYVAPERLANEAFQAALAGSRVACLAVDEAHCISAWGHDFRPDYLRLPLLLEALGGPPVLALTATAPPAVQQDIITDLGIPTDGVINTGARRPNLALRVEAPADREQRLMALLAQEPAAPTIVYALRQADTERLARRLQGAGYAAAAYHAGLEAAVRSDVQDRFLSGDLTYITATVAFGMGVDKPDVRRIVHVHAPRSLEGYVQEVGRAGRDGLPATATLLYDDADLVALANFADARAPDAEAVRAALNLAFSPANREAPDVIAFSPQTVGDAAHVDPVTVRTLFARLERRGVVRALTPVFDEYRVALEHDPAAVESTLGARDAATWQQVVSAGKRGRTWLTVSVSGTVQATDASYEAVRKVLRRIEDEGLASVQAAGALQRYRVQRRPDRDTDLPALLQSVSEGLEGEHRRLERVRAFVLETGCRQAHALAYLGEADLSPCGVCDLCAGAAPLTADQIGAAARDWPAELATRGAARLTHEMAAVSKETADAIGIAQGLCQVLTARSRPYRRALAWGAFERAPYNEVLAAVRQALSGAPGA